MARSLIRLALAGAVVGGLASAAPAQAETCFGTFVCVPADVVVTPVCLPYQTPQICVVL